MKSNRWMGFGLTALTYLVAILVFFPILWMVLTSFKTEGDAFAFPPQLFFSPTLANWQIALLDSNFTSHLGLQLHQPPGQYTDCHADFNSDRPRAGYSGGLCPGLLPHPAQRFHPELVDLYPNAATCRHYRAAVRHFPGFGAA